MTKSLKMDNNIKNKIKKILINLGIFVLTIILILIILEVAVRIFAKPVYPILQTDEKVGTIHKKNFDGKIWNNESKTWNYIRTNSLGYIGDEVKKEKPSDTIRIAMLGDSMVEALQVDYYNNFVSKLNTILNLTLQQKFEILNFGVGGSGIFLQYQTYKYKIAQLQPDAIFLFFHDDYVDDLNKINFDLENYTRETRKNLWLKNFLLKFQMPKFVFYKLQHNLFFIDILNKFGLYEMNENLRGRKSGEIDILQHQEYYNYTFSIIKKLKDLIEDNKTDFYVILLPFEEDYSVGEFCKKEIDKIIEFLEKENIEYLNPCQQLYQAKKNYSKEQYFTFGGAGHINKLGHEEFAKILYQYIIKNK